MKFIMFGNRQCTRCRLLKPKYEAYGEQYADTDDNEMLVSMYGIRSLPTVIAVDDSGKEVNRLVPPFTPADLDAFITKERNNG